MDNNQRPSWIARLSGGLERLRQSEDQLSLVLSLVIGALVGLVVVAFILLTGRLAARMYPAGGSGWRRILVPVLGSLSTGYLLWRYFPFARGSGIPQTKFALFIDDGRILFRTVLGKFFCCSASLASGIALGREGPSVQVGAGLASVIARNLGLNPKQVKARLVLIRVCGPLSESGQSYSFPLGPTQSGCQDPLVSIVGRFASGVRASTA